MKKILLSTVVALVIALLLGGCDSPPRYTVKGEVLATKCVDTTNNRYSYVELDNGATYFHDDLLGCKLKDGTKVSITHDGDLEIVELIVDGTTKNGNNNKDNKQ